MAETRAVAGLPLGVLGRAHGLRGELFLRVFNAGGSTVETLRLPVPVDLQREGRTSRWTLRSARRAGDGYLVSFEGAPTREAAAALTNSTLLVLRETLPPLTSGEFYVHDLVGCTAVDSLGQSLGVVRSAFWNGAQDVLLVEDDARNERLIPVVPEFLRDVQISERRVVVDLPAESAGDEEHPAGETE